MKPSAVLVVLQILLVSCNATEAPPGGEPVLRLAALDASCTEVWLEVKLAAGVQPRILTLQRDTQTVLTTTLIATDTLIVDEGLFPNRQYTYTLTRPAGVFTDRTSAPITTMDTTSHNWTFSVDTLGDGNSSVLNDVAIINDTLILAVGEIFLRDSTGRIDPIAYSVAIWNGSNWTLKRLYYSGNNLIAPVRGIFAFGANDVWLAAGSVFHWDGVSSQAQLSFSRFTLPDPNATVEKLWGISSTNLYGVGNAGTIVHYANGTWQRIESGTTLPVNDIWGASNTRTGGVEILCIASRKFQNQGKKVLKIDVATVSVLSDSGLPFYFSGMWFDPNKRYYIVGPGIYQKRSADDNGLWVGYPSGVVTSFYTNSIHGQGINDVVATGAFGEVVHFNGKTWMNYYSITQLASGSYYSVKIKGNTIVAVGSLYDRAVVVRGTRQ